MKNSKEKLDVKKMPDGTEYVEMPYNGTTLIIRNSIEPGRINDETRDEYVVRRKLVNSRVNKYLKGGIFWSTGLLGTYSKVKLRELTDELLKEEDKNKAELINKELGLSK